MTLSNVELWNVGAAFWGLVMGCLAALGARAARISGYF